MSIPNRTTIDNLGLPASNRYASDQTQLNTPIAQDIRESTDVSKRTQVSVFSPSQLSELEALLGPSRVVRTIADFWSPGSSMINQSFSFLLIPSLGPLEKQETLVQKIDEQILSNKKKRQADLKKVTGQKDLDEQQKKRALWQMQREEQEEEIEKKHLLSLFHLVQYLNKCLTDANAHRNQYQRG